MALVVDTRLEFNLFPEKAEIILRDHLGIGSEYDLKFTASEFLFEIVSEIRSFTLRSVVRVDVDVGGEFTEFSDPVLERGSWYENEVGSGVAPLSEVSDKGNDLDCLAETCKSEQESVKHHSPISSAKIHPIFLDHKRFNQLTPRSW